MWDVDGNRYVDLTAGFGVAAVGHGHPAVVEAVRRQAARLGHGMGDVHPPAIKVELLEKLADLSPFSDSRAVLGLSGSDAVEIALKTACLATGKPGVLAFSGAYHGLGYGALSVTDRACFRAPFEAQLNPHVVRAEFPNPYRPGPALRGAGADLLDRALTGVEAALESPAGARVGAVIVEPLQGRGGDVVPPRTFLARLASLCRERGLLLILDEIYTGFGRTGNWFACQAEEVQPDLLCVGKAFSGGMPISACLGTSAVMDAWPESEGEAMHTSTFLGHPVGCAAALAALETLEAEGLVARAREQGSRWLAALQGLADRHDAVGDVRGRGLMVGLDLVSDRETKRPDPRLARSVALEALRRGWILLLGGPAGNVLSLSPPLNIGAHLLDAAAETLDDVLAGVTGTSR